MSAWSSIAKALTNFFRGGGGKVAASGAAEAAQAGTKVILTWGPPRESKVMTGNPITLTL